MVCLWLISFAVTSSWNAFRLGRDRIGIFVGDKDKSTIKQFLNSCVLDLNYAVYPWFILLENSRKIHQVLIIGYERLRTVMCVLKHAYVV